MIKHRTLKKLLWITIFVLWAIPAFAQVDTAWVRRYNGPGNDGDGAQGIALDSSGNVYVAGASWGGGTNFDYATIKYDSDGNTAWVRRYNGPGNSTDTVLAKPIAVDDSGNVYVTGASGGSGTSGDYATIKYNSNGDTAWVRRYNGPGNDMDAAFAITVDDAGNVYVTGLSDYDTLPESGDYATIKYYPNGDVASGWPKTYDGPGNWFDFAYAIAVDASGNVYLTGFSWGNGTFFDYATIKYYPNGDTVWVRRYNGLVSGWEKAYAIAVDGSGNVYVTGKSEGTGGDDYATIKYEPDGDTAWVRRYNGSVNDYNDDANAIAVDNSNNVYVTGYSYSDVTDNDYATIKYYPNGDTHWVRGFNGPGNGVDAAFAIAVDSCGNAYVTGYSWNGTDFDYATVKYDSSGNELWVETYNGPGNGDDKASAIAVCGCDTVYVTGESYGSGTGSDYATIKYVPVYSISGNVRDGSGLPLEDSLVFLAGDRTAEDTTDSNGDYEFTGLPSGNYKVFRDSSISMYHIHLTSDTSGFNFIGYTDVDNSIGQQEKSLTFALSTNYPNPFNPQTVIEYTLNSPCQVTLKIYNIKGQLIKTLIDVHQRKGFHQIIWDGTNEKGENTSSGIYFCQLKAKDYVITKKMVKLK